MLNDKERSAKFQSDFYRDRYRGMLRALITSVAVILLLTCITIGLILTRPAPHYYASTTEGMIVPLVPLTMYGSKK